MSDQIILYVKVYIPMNVHPRIRLALQCADSLPPSLRFPTNIGLPHANPLGFHSCKKVPLLIWTRPNIHKVLPEQKAPWLVFFVQPRFFCHDSPLPTPSRLKHFPLDMKQPKSRLTNNAGTTKTSDPWESSSDNLPLPWNNCLPRHIAASTGYQVART